MIHVNQLEVLDSVITVFIMIVIPMMSLYLAAFLIHLECFLDDFFL